MLKGDSSQYREKSLPERFGDVLGPILPSGRIRSSAKRFYNRFLTLVIGGDSIKCRLPEGELISVSVLHRNIVWNPKEYTAFRRAVKPGDIVFDVGANVGAYSLLYGQWVGLQGRVYAFEPEPAAYKALCTHIELNDLTGIVLPFQLAVSSSPGTATFSVDSPSGTNRVLQENATVGTSISVPMTSIDAFCAEHDISPTLIKVDVEGAELEVMRGARSTLRRQEKLTLFVEMHPSLWATMGLSKESVLKEFHSLGLVPRSLDGSLDVDALEGVCFMVERLPP